MSTKKAGVWIAITADASGAVKGFREAEGAAAKFKAVGKGLGDIGNSFASIGRKLTTHLTVPLVAFAGLAVRAFADSQKAVLELQNAIKNNPKLARESTSAFEAQAKAIQKKTAADDESILRADAVLANFKLTRKQILETIPVVVDYARKTGRSVPEAAALIGKAALGNARALKELGINFKATGDEGKDFSTALALVGSKVKGFAEAEGKTASGRLTILKNRFGELQETIGAKLLPIGERLLSWADRMLDKWEHLSPATQGFIIKAAGIAAVLGPALGVVGKMSSGLGGIAKFLGIIGRGIGVLDKFPKSGGVLGDPGAFGREAATGFNSMASTIGGAIGVAVAAYLVYRHFVPDGGPGHKPGRKVGEAAGAAYGKSHPSRTVIQPPVRGGRGYEGDPDMKVHGGGAIRRFHAGGWGRLSSDEVPAILQNDEHVVRASSARPNRAALEYINRTGKMPGGPTLNVHAGAIVIHAGGADSAGIERAMDRALGRLADMISRGG